ncbi:MULTISPECIES: hypothetical protein [unclassified Sphingopyxis]|jgi:hypothetical protein|nr:MULTISPECIES: hypothetical protein [unclassified Sphingopyxis]HET6525429.1 hypothetical protein [Sphingopyxis sp.]HMO73807.1 hypothetical protein [Sphingopyxis sp.]HMP43638.1 hypothetical protein [Sphingopyxis sp.]
MDRIDNAEIEELGVASVETLGGLLPYPEDGSVIHFKPDGAITAD